MKGFFVTFTASICAFMVFVHSPANSQGYRIGLSLKPYGNQWVYLASYYGGIKVLMDSAFLDANSQGVLKGSKPLPQGVYVVASPSKVILLELLLGKDQEFDLSANTLKPNYSISFYSSDENDAFSAYTQFIKPIGIAIEELKKKMETAPAASVQNYQDEIDIYSARINSYRRTITKQMPNSMLATIFMAIKSLEYPKDLQNPITMDDRIEKQRWGKLHYWDNVDFTDGRLVRTPIFESKLKDYLNNFVTQDADSLIYEFHWMIALGSNDPEMFKYLVGYFIDNYMYPKTRGLERVFLNVYQRFISGPNPTANWLNEYQVRVITDRASAIMRQNDLSQPNATSDRLNNRGSQNRFSYEINASYTPSNNVKIDNTKVVITPTKSGGVYELPVEINGIPMSFIFDTGAGLVSISLAEINFLLKQKRFSQEDVLDSQNFIDANGDVTTGAIVNLKSIQIGNRIVRNVRAAVVLNQKAPLLLGQSFIQRFGKVTIDNMNNVIVFE